MTEYDLMFIANSIFLGSGLAMDAFSVCVANGLNEVGMRNARKYKIAGVFGIFQAAMPMIGWICVRAIAEAFGVFQKFIPWIALTLLLCIGGKMIYEAVIKDKKEANEKTDEKMITGKQLFIQGIATSIDALTVGFTIVDYSFAMALVSATIIGIITLVMCMAGLRIGRKVGEKFTEKASIFGGIILISIGIEIFLTH